MYMFFMGDFSFFFSGWMLIFVLGGPSLGVE